MLDQLTLQPSGQFPYFFLSLALFGLLSDSAGHAIQLTAYATHSVSERTSKRRESTGDL